MLLHKKTIIGYAPPEMKQLIAGKRYIASQHFQVLPSR